MPSLINFDTEPGSSAGRSAKVVPRESKMVSGKKLAVFLRYKMSVVGPSRRFSVAPFSVAIGGKADIAPALSIRTQAPAK